MAQLNRSKSKGMLAFHTPSEKNDEPIRMLWNERKGVAADRCIISILWT
jgi:hypothetical protein